MSLVFTWLRLSSTRQLPWYKNSNYQSKDIAHVQKAVAQNMAEKVSGGCKVLAAKCSEGRTLLEFPLSMVINRIHLFFMSVLQPELWKTFYCITFAAKRSSVSWRWLQIRDVMVAMLVLLRVLSASACFQAG